MYIYDLSCCCDFKPPNINKIILKTKNNNAVFIMYHKEMENKYEYL